MSSVYVLEPPTKGKVVLNTTCGPLDIELWSKEAPKASRNFVQLCMEGYYDHTFFHRVIKEFLVQGGDHTGTGEGGESIYGEPFPDEIHTRLKFRHRGFVACAGMQDKKNSNNSQFFITLTRCDWIDGKHTIFGKVTGDTIYNLLKLAECETGKDDRPLEPNSITSTEVLWNPFDDILPRNRIKPVETPAAPPQEKTKQKKQLNLLSFGDEAEEEVPVNKAKITSSHDVLDDPRLLKPVQEQVVEDNEKRKKELSAVKQALAGKSSKEPTEDPVSDREDEESFDARMRQQVMEKKRKWDDKKAKQSPSTETRPKREEPDEKEESEEDEEDENVVRKDKLVIKKKGIGSEAKADMALKKDVEMQLLTPQEQQRQKYKQQKRNLRGREESTMALLEGFRQKLTASKTSVPEKPSEGEAPEKEEVDTAGLFNHKLKFQLDKKDKMSRNDDIDQYVVVDPLLEKGKEEFNKQQANLKRRNRAWAGKSYT